MDALTTLPDPDEVDSLADLKLRMESEGSVEAGPMRTVTVVIRAPQGAVGRLTEAIDSINEQLAAWDGGAEIIHNAETLSAPNRTADRLLALLGGLKELRKVALPNGHQWNRRKGKYFSTMGPIFVVGQDEILEIPRNVFEWANTIFASMHPERIGLESDLLSASSLSGDTSDGNATSDIAHLFKAQAATGYGF